MKRSIVNYFFISILCIPACTPAGPLAKDPVIKTTVEGVSYDVQKMPGTENSWAANSSNLWGGYIDPEDYLKNIEAIEKVTGCKVVPETISNQGLRTTAYVKCKKVK